MKILLRRLAAAAVICAGSTAGLTQAASQGALLVVTKQSHSLAIVDGATLQVLAHVPIGEDPHEVTVGPDGRTAYVSNYGEGTLHTLAVVDLLRRKALPAIDLTPLVGPHGLMAHDKTLWFTVEGSKALATLDPATGRVQTVLGTGPVSYTHLDVYKRQALAGPAIRLLGAADAPAFRFKHSMANETFEGWTLGDTCKAIRKAGYTGIEIAPFTFADDPPQIPAGKRREYASVMSSEGLKYVAMHHLLMAPKGLHITLSLIHI